MKNTILFFPVRNSIKKIDISMKPVVLSKWKNNSTLLLLLLTSMGVATEFWKIRGLGLYIHILNGFKWIAKLSRLSKDLFFKCIGWSNLLWITEWYCSMDYTSTFTKIGYILLAEINAW